MPRFGTLLSLLLVGLAVTATRPARAAVKDFPYEAIIEADEALVRCGPGKNFYTTIKLTRGQHVTVRRHDPGGWFMIDPPAGSFSLIRVEDVVQEGNIATVKRLDVGQASVRIGSALDPTADSIFQRKLSSGERAEILGEVIIPRKDRQVPMFRIRPPRGEFRWIEGNDVAPLDPQIKQQLTRDPFSTPPRAYEVRHDHNQNGPPSVAATSTHAAPTDRRPIAQPASTSSARKSGLTSAQQVVTKPAAFDPRGRLEQIDFDFRDMIQKDPPTWNLTQIEQAYNELRQNPAAAGVAGQVDLRFSALSHYKQVKSQYDDYYRLVSSTSRRDAELAAVENSLAPQNSRPPIGPSLPGGGPSPDSSGDPNDRTPMMQSPAAAPTLSLPTYPQSSNAPQSAPEGQTFSQPQSGPTLGTPVPVPTESQPLENRARESRPTENRPSIGGAPSQLPSDSSVYAPNAGAFGPNSGNASQGQLSPSAPVGTDFPRSNFGAPTGPSEMNSVQPLPPQQGTRTHTSQFNPSATTQPPSGYPGGANSPAISPQMPSNNGLQLMPGQPGPGSTLGQPNPATSQGYMPQNQMPPQQYQAGAGPPPGAFPQQGVQQPATQQQGPPQGMTPQGGFPQNGTAAGTPALAAPRQIHPQGSPPLDGAGIIQRAAATSPNGPRHVLLAPNGRILAYLQAGGGVNLDAYVGRPMGIMGARAYRPELQTDLIVVRGIIPVRLTP
ncbi:MAG TPA: hypothetical protein VGP63_22410 [Planctomycetaceae bacterium]|jgi:hypothetical protein|nr:hypothetical protein [Planctomycetaceae bacterium]